MVRIFTVIIFLFIVVASLGKTVVVDPGHGGKSPGAVYGKVLEKTVNLKVALLVEHYLSVSDPSVRVVLTRRDDRDVTLNARSDLANRADADLFISIHCNANPSTSAFGSETYVMGIDKSGANLSVAMAENSVISLESDFQSVYGGYDPQSSESVIIFSLMQYAHQDRSLHFASSLQRHFGLSGAPRPRARGVKQAGFLVLWRTTMPSVLTEVGFLSNDGDRAKLASVDGQKAIAKAIAGAVIDFLKESPSVSVPPPVSPPQPAKSASAIGNTVCDSLLVKYFVQIRTSPRSIDINSMNFGAWVLKIREQKVGNLYKYWVGSADSYKEALNLQSQLRTKYGDCFIVAAVGDRQITLAEAKEILEPQR